MPQKYYERENASEVVRHDDETCPQCDAEGLVYYKWSG